ncbi:MAG: penicillin acylase family protein [Planctomycetes bacterium]|nr:penicillin acylase family protein [Planctomycetota bacterium]
MILIWFGAPWILSFSVADYDGQIQLTGIENPVEITFDAKGVPQVWAKTDADMYFALGWLHASERLFQMEFIRRVSNGRLSEIVGEVTYEVDLMLRRFGLARKAQSDIESLDPDSERLIDSYCAGVNSWIHSKKILPPEFVLLRIEPRDWQPVDVLSATMYLTWFTHFAVNSDSSYNMLHEKLGPRVIPLLREHKHRSLPTVPDTFLESMFSHNLLQPGLTAASNSWVIAPRKSNSGAAIHANDPHLQINVTPGFWYLAGLHSEEGTDILGGTILGMPFVGVGHNRAIGYGPTVSSVDIIDYYRFQRHPTDSLQILTDTGYQPLELIQESILIRGEDQPRTENIYWTPRGVVFESDSSEVIALKWAGFDFNSAEIAKSIFKLHRASNFQEFRETVTKFGAYNVNWTYSDSAGNIGFQPGSPIPKRDYDNTYIRLAGEDSSTCWRGYYELEQMPYLYNPDEGWLANCNNRIATDKWPYDIPGFYLLYRIMRANELLSRDTTFSQEDMAAMQMDITSPLARRWKGIMADGADQLNKGALAEDIRQWNGEMSIDRTLPLVFNLWWQILPHKIFEDELGLEWKSAVCLLEGVLSDSLAVFIDNSRTTDRIETPVDISAAALDSALQISGRRLYGDASFFEVSHPLGQLKILDYWLDLKRGPFPYAGDETCLNSNFTFYNQEENCYYTAAGPSLRSVLDWSDIDNFTIHLNLGQSGNPFSPHFDDFLEIWRNGGSWVVPMTKEKVFAGKTEMLTLLPE